MMVRGRIAMHGGLGDLLLDSRSFRSWSNFWSLLGLREHHSLQQLFYGVNGLVGLL